MTDQILPEPGAEPGTATGSWPYAPQARVPEGLAIASAVIAVVVAAIQLSSAVASASAEDTYREALLDGNDPYAVLTVYDGLEVLWLPALIAAYVVSCLWLHSARKTALAITPDYPPDRSEVWVWLGWWVPIVSLWFPFQVVRDVRDATRPTGAQIGLGLWWGTWLALLMGSRITGRLSASTNPDVVDLLSLAEWATAIVAVVACVQWCRIIHRITTDQLAAVTPR